MKEEISRLIEISRFYGQNPDYVIAGGGNTSFKDNDHLYIKASGVHLSDITENGFCVLDRKKLAELYLMNYPDDVEAGDRHMKDILSGSLVNEESGLSPSIETPLHNLFDYRFVVHTHSTLVNGLLCSNHAAGKSSELFGDKVLYCPHAFSGYTGFKEVLKLVDTYKKESGKCPQVILIRNHGIFVAADSTDEIKKLYEDVTGRIKGCIPEFHDTENFPVSSKLANALPAIRMLFSESDLKIVSAFNTSWIDPFLENREIFEANAGRPFDLVQMVYCLSEYPFIEGSSNTEDIVRQVGEKAKEFKQRNGIFPRVFFIQGEGAIVSGDSAALVEYMKLIVNDFCRISNLSRNFGGPHPLTESEIRFLKKWEVENYRPQKPKAEEHKGKVANKIIIVTGAAQGFGAGLAEIMHDEGANIVIADINQENGQEAADRLNRKKAGNKAVFVPVDVSDPVSVENMVRETVLLFGGLDVMISNAGILRAGSLDETEPETFDLMTRVNYTGYYLCARSASRIMKLQNRINPGYFMDIIQINSKSGLKGSDKNFAYAGSKFGGIGLTQSFAFELAPYHIKVNSICPGNYFDGPLWSDPETGLFVQYLRTGKVPGAKTIGDVKAFYEAKVPAGRGCTPGDVAKAVLYVIDQEYETGQAVPVTGGQVMLR